MTKKFTTLSRRGEFELIEKKSRFLGYAESVSGKDAAEAFIHEIKAAHPEARHHVFAYSVGGADKESEIRRMSDDGEPQGTGGIPCLDVITKRGLSHVAVVVVRYFGGILLGAPGLVRAYGKCAAGAISDAGECEMICCRRVKVESDYPLFGKLSRLAESLGRTPESPVFGDKVSFTVTIPDADAIAFANRLYDASGGKAILTVSDDTFFVKE